MYEWVSETIDFVEKRSLSEDNGEIRDEPRQDVQRPADCQGHSVPAHALLAVGFREI